MIKKFFSLQLILFILMSMYSHSYVLSSYMLVQTDIIIGDKILKDEIILLYNGRALIPIKKVGNILNLSVDWDEINKKVTVSDKNNKVEIFTDQNKVLVNNQVSFIDTYSKIYNDVCYVPARFVSDIFGLGIGWENKTKTLSLGNVKKEFLKEVIKEVSNKGKITSIDLLDIKTSNNDKSDVIELKLNGTYQYKDFKIESPTRVVLDFAGTFASTIKKSYDINASTVKQIRVGQFTQNTARVVFDLENNSNYDIKSANDKIFISVEKNKSKQNNPQKITTKVSEIKKRLEEGRKIEQAKRLEIKRLTELNKNTKELKKITFVDSKEYFEIELDAKLSDGINYKRLTDPDRILIKLPFIVGIQCENYPIAQKYLLKNDILKSIEWQNNTNETSIYFDLNKQYNFEVKEKNNKIYFKISKSLYDNFKYHNSGDRVYLEFMNLKLKSDDRGFENLYTEKDEPLNNKYSIYFDKKMLPSPKYKFMINDDYLNNIEFIDIGGKTSVIFNGNQKQEYLVSYRKSTDSSTVTMLKPATQNEKIILIDPGHGGLDPGAVSNLIKEKEINLDIANRLNKLLKENNVKTYMIRDNDSYVSLYERVNIANKMKGCLFLSIHHNAYYAVHSGTETLYFPLANNVSKSFATIIQNKLIQALGFKNRGIVQRPNLVVLKETLMPSALTEVGFITNPNEYGELMKETTRQKTAKALSDSVLEFLNDQII